MRPSRRELPEECSLGVRPNQLAKWRASLKCVTSPEVAADHGCGGEQSDARDAEQGRARRAVPNQGSEFALELRHASFKQSDLLDQEIGGRSQQLWHRGVRFSQDTRDLLDTQTAALGDGDAELTAKAAQCVDALSAIGLPETAGAMQALQRLLLDGFDAHGLDVGIARGLQERGGVSGIGLVATHVGANVGRRQQQHLDAQAIEPACPVMSRTARLHHDQGHRSVEEEALELVSAQAAGLEHSPGRVSDAQLKDVLGEVDTNHVPCVGRNRGYRNLDIGDSIHVGLLRVAPMPHTT